MKRLIFLLIAFACGLTTVIASDVGSKPTLQLPTSVITQITAMPVLNAVCFEMTPVIYQASGVTLVNKYQMVGKTFMPVAILHLDPGIYIQVSVNKFNLQNRTSNNSYTPYSMLNNYELLTVNYELNLPTARHVS